MDSSLSDPMSVYAEPVQEPALQTCNCRWDGEMQMQQCTLHEAHIDAIKEWAQRAKFAEKKLAALAEPVAYTTGHCKEKAKPGGCQLHNLHCGYPECDRKPAQERAEPVQEPIAWYHVHCPNCASLQDQNTELDRKLAEMERKLLELQAAVLQSHGIRSGDA